MSTRHTHNYTAPMITRTNGPGLVRLVRDYKRRLHELATESTDLRDTTGDPFSVLPLCLGPCGGYRISHGYRCCEKCRGSYNSKVTWAEKQLLGVSSRMNISHVTYPDIRLVTPPPTLPNQLWPLEIVDCPSTHCWKPSHPSRMSVFRISGAGPVTQPFVITHDDDDLIHIRHPRGELKFYVEQAYGEMTLIVELTSTTREVWGMVLSGVRYTTTHMPGTVLYHRLDQCYQICSKSVTKY